MAIMRSHACSGRSAERIHGLVPPVDCRRVTQDLSVSPVYDAIFWNPPASERYQMKHARPPKPDNIKVYEAHVGIATPEPRVGSYPEFSERLDYTRRGKRGDAYLPHHFHVALI